MSSRFPRDRYQGDRKRYSCGMWLEMTKSKYRKGMPVAVNTFPYIHNSQFPVKLNSACSVSDGESECGSYCLLIILLSICIAIGVGSVAVIIAIAFIAS